jgi:hypothetical protein
VENREPKLRCSCIQRLFGRNPAAMSRRVSLTRVCEELARSRATQPTRQREAEILRSGFPFTFRNGSISKHDHFRFTKTRVPISSSRKLRIGGPTPDNY